MVEILLQRLVQDPSARVAPRSPKSIEEAIMDPPPKAKAKDKEIKNEEGAIKAQEDKSGPNTADWGKGLIWREDLHIPNDPNLHAVMKEAKIDYEDFARTIVHHTTIMMQEAQMTQLKLFQRMQLSFQNQVQEIDNRHQESIKEANVALSIMSKQIKELQDMEEAARMETARADQWELQAKALERDLTEARGHYKRANRAKSQI